MATADYSPPRDVRATVGVTPGSVTATTIARTSTCAAESEARKHAILVYPCVRSDQFVQSGGRAVSHALTHPDGVEIRDAATGEFLAAFSRAGAKLFLSPDQRRSLARVEDSR